MRAAPSPGSTRPTAADDLIRAVLDGVALALRDAASEFGGAFDGGPIAMIGGGSKSGLWMRVVANALGRPLLKLAGGDSGPAFGAARLARIAATGETVAAVCGQPAIIEIVDPDPTAGGAIRRTAGAFPRPLPLAQAGADISFSQGGSAPARETVIAAALAAKARTSASAVWSRRGDPRLGEPPRLVETGENGGGEGVAGADGVDHIDRETGNAGRHPALR